MLKIFSKVALSTLVASSIALGASLSAFASPVPSNLVPTQNINENIQGIPDNSVQPNGVKKWITTQAMKVVSKALRSGGDLVDKIVRELGGKEATYFAKHTDTIADALDDLIARGDVVEDAIMDTVATALISAGVPNGVARTIAAGLAFIAF